MDEGAFQELSREVVATFHRLRAAAEEVHGEGGGTAARRGVLRELAREGPRTVPAMARGRRVSRQHVQSVVNDLLADGLVELRDNPAHRRSKLVALTGAGERRMRIMERRERGVLSRFDAGVPAGALRRAATTLRRLREAMDGEAWGRSIHREDEP